ncbi:MAG: hypothetical protein LKH78_10665 [Weizmannia coagulans]|jgi:ribosomal protein L7/L12|uniref:hypothetical protein n=1 Tax=Heyndrickxia TaxID=2837504 RepID=UPI00054E256E|nr:MULTISPECIES: hypothetical protein [Heyndrickxia]AVD55707.1 hypothetical protein C3766_06005 [Heyndrickxia coagulans]AWP36595.1 hypothetical protein CYJ15_06210 [Heyndrickxia coagulans]KGT38967.1 hypothetical protein P421_07275 [Heyndrickxia coagulans P38]KYC61635.1 hypothetical protein B4100_0136 [Heyndrickxia coagulans]MBQ4911095.1 hypothetical protein [Heyndrickxia faecalis]
MNWGLITSLILNVAFLIYIVVLTNKVNALRKENTKPSESNDELIALAQEKLKLLGAIKTVKFLREEKGMSMLDAKQLVDALKKQE